MTKTNTCCCRLTAIMALLFFCTSVFCQTNISGIVNTYYQVLEVIPAKSCVRLNTVAGINYGDKAMLVQMKGAAINITASSASFGDTSSLNSAGNYEITDICFVNGDTVFFVHTILNQYSVTDKVQLVRIPEYNSATVVDTLKASPWNNTTGTGGVLAIFVAQDLVLNAPISADSVGYRGGANIVSNGTCTNIAPASQYAYPGANTAPQNGAYKGEGVADVGTTINGGRGAPANGGGGGNNHNNGGGGGANLTAGGIGGGNSSTAGCTTTLAGRAGKALSSYGGKKIFMGGGGGAGHGNSGLVVSHGGGNGGGLVFIHTENLSGNGMKISANGRMGGPALGDGASGGGAGGTIIMDVGNYIGSATIEANGGTGGTENDGGNVGRCYGAGGGGSGGAIYFSGTTPPVTVTANGGNAGAETGRDASCAAAVLPAAGSAGQVIQNYSYSRSFSLSGTNCSFQLATELAWFRAGYTNGLVSLKWKITEPETVDRFIIEKFATGNSWITVRSLPASDNLFSYTSSDPAPNAGYNTYRLKIIQKSGAVIYSLIQKIYVPGRNEAITIFPNPANKKITITGITPGASLALSDISGQLVWQKKLITNQTSVEIELPELPAGVYIMKVGDIAKRLVIR